jgi:hypothetical protein
MKGEYAAAAADERELAAPPSRRRWLDIVLCVLAVAAVFSMLWTIPRGDAAVAKAQPQPELLGPSPPKFATSASSAEPSSSRKSADTAPVGAPAVAAKLRDAMVSGDAVAGAAALAAAAALGRDEAASLLYKALDLAHGFGGAVGGGKGGGPSADGDFVEGYASPEEQRALRDFLTTPTAGTRTICETGFNAGHGAANYLLANAFGLDLTYVGFDIGTHPYSRKGEAFLKVLFPGRVRVVYGDSAHTLALIHGQDPELVCDGAMVDGLHTKGGAATDLAGFVGMLTRVGSRLAIDDVQQRPLKQAWDDMVRTGQLGSPHCSALLAGGAPASLTPGTALPKSARAWCFGTVQQKAARPAPSRQIKMPPPHTWKPPKKRPTATEAADAQLKGMLQRATQGRKGCGTGKGAVC